MSITENKVCDRCGVEIPDSIHRRMSDIDTYWCDMCQETGSESWEQVEQRLADRETLGVKPRPDNPVAVFEVEPARGRGEADQ